MTYPANEIAQKIQDMYFENGAIVSKETWDETLRLLDQHSAHIVERILEMKMKEVDFSDPFYDTRGERQNEQMLAQMQTTIRVHNQALDQAIDIIKDNK